MWGCAHKRRFHNFLLDRALSSPPIKVRCFEFLFHPKSNPATGAPFFLPSHCVQPVRSFPASMELPVYVRLSSSFRRVREEFPLSLISFPLLLFYLEPPDILLAAPRLLCVLKDMSSALCLPPSFQLSLSWWSFARKWLDLFLTLFSPFPRHIKTLHPFALFPKFACPYEGDF